jgi:hypothetical protein
MTTSDVHDSTQPTMQADVPGPPYDDDDMEPAFRPRPRKRAHALTFILAALVVAAAGYVVGVQVQKHDDKNSSSSASSVAQRFRNAASASGAATGGSGTGGSRGGGAFGNRTGGTVKLVDGNNVYITDVNGNTVKIATNAGTQMSKSVAATIKDVAPGATITVTGTQNADGSITATSLSIANANGLGGLSALFGGGGNG